MVMIGNSSSSGQASSSSSVERDRIFDSDVKIEKFSLPFRNKTYEIQVATTCYGDHLYGSTGALMLAKDCNEQSARQYLYKTLERLPLLRHNNISIQEHLQCLKQLSYKYHGKVFVTYHGLKIVIEASQSKYTTEHRDEILYLLKEAHESAWSSIHIATHGASGQKTHSPKKYDSEDSDELQPEATMSLALVHSWPKLSQFYGCKEEYEKAVETYFSLPAFVRVREKMEKLENEWQHEALLIAEEAASTHKLITGYVYALWNPLFPDLLKIGATFRTPELRSRELSRTGLPESFHVVSELHCTNPFKTEREVHLHYAHVRKYGKKKEFFTLTPTEIMDHFKTLKARAMEAPSESDQAAIHKRTKRMRMYREHHSDSVPEEKEDFQKLPRAPNCQVQ